MSIRRPGLAYLAVLLLLAPADLSGQTVLTASGGPNTWDLSGTGDGWTAALAAERRIGGPLSMEARLAYFAAPDADDDPFRALFPEVGLVVAAPTALPLRLTAGAGWSLGLGGWPEDDPTLFVALGARFGVGNGWALGPEVRIRAVDPWVGTIAEFTFGISREVGR